MRYKVANGGSILARNREVLKPGTIVDGGSFSPKSLNDHLKNGYLVAVEVAANPDSLVEVAPGQNKTHAPVPSEITGKATVAVPTQKPPAPVVTGRWNFNPLVIQGKSLEQLNVMILERDASVKPYETKEEAIAHLTQDFKG